MQTSPVGGVPIMEFGTIRYELEDDGAIARILMMQAQIAELEAKLAAADQA